MPYAARLRRAQRKALAQGEGALPAARAKNLYYTLTVESYTYIIRNVHVRLSESCGSKLGGLRLFDAKPEDDRRRTDDQAPVEEVVHRILIHFILTGT